MIKERRISKNQQKVLLLLSAGLALGLTRSPKVTWKILQQIPKEWGAIDRRGLTSATKTLYQSKLVSAQPHKDGSYTLVLTNEGRKLALRYHLDTMVIPKQKVWDGKWRLVLYDIPEKIRHLRADVAATLKRLGFYEIQHSVFIHPYECTREIEYLIERYEAREYVRFMLVEHIDDDAPVLKHFKLNKQ
jgi:DNA-binding transcriptional regulator PaaX